MSHSVSLFFMISLLYIIDDPDISSAERSRIREHRQEDQKLAISHQITKYCC